jgi:hypothetical protein
MGRAWTLLATGCLLACASRARPIVDSPTPAAIGKAQQPLPVDSGSRIRVVRRRGRPRELTGTLVARRADSLVLVVDRRARQRVVAMPDVRSLEVSRGTRRHVLRSAAHGLVGAAGIGAFLSLVGSWAFCVSPFVVLLPECPIDGGDRREIVKTGAAVGGVLGVGFGVLYGYFDRDDTWERVPLERLPAGGASFGRVGVGVSLRLPPLGR